MWHWQLFTWCLFVCLFCAIFVRKWRNIILQPLLINNKSHNFQGYHVWNIDCIWPWALLILFVRNPNIVAIMAVVHLVSIAKRKLGFVRSVLAIIPEVESHLIIIRIHLIPYGNHSSVSSSLSLPSHNPFTVNESY